MIQMLLVALPAAWLAGLLAMLAWPLTQALALALWQLWPGILAWQGVLLWAGPAVGLLGSILLAVQVLQHRRGYVWMLDDAIAALGIAAFGVACAFTPAGSWLQWVVVPGLAFLLFWPILGTVILMLLTTQEDDIGTTLMRLALFTAGVAGLHTWVVGW